MRLKLLVCLASTGVNTPETMSPNFGEEDFSGGWGAF
jgi:hypothetical protein